MPLLSDAPTWVILIALGLLTALALGLIIYNIFVRRQLERRPTGNKTGKGG